MSLEDTGFGPYIVVNETITAKSDCICVSVSHWLCKLSVKTEAYVVHETIDVKKVFLETVA